MNVSNKPIGLGEGDDRQLALLAQVAQQGLLELLQLPAAARPAARHEKLGAVQEFLDQFARSLVPNEAVSTEVAPDPLARQALESILARRRLSPERRGVSQEEVTRAKSEVMGLMAGRTDDEPML